MTRLLDRFGPDLAALRGDELRDAIRASEGRTMLAEVVAPAAPLQAGTANAELVAAFGADLVCLNLADPTADGVLVTGLDRLDPPPRGFDGLARLLARPVGLNLEPAMDSVPDEHRATAVNARAAAAGGAAFVIVTANPGRGATVADLAAAVDTVRRSAPDLLCLAGKMHHAGAEEPVGASVADALLGADAHGVLVPVPGTVPGVSEDAARAVTARVRGAGGLAVGAVGTSQEGADVATIRQLAVTAKRVGVDVHHLGDAGLGGVADPRNLYVYGVAVRGVRHTWNRMARGVRGSWRG